MTRKIGVGIIGLGSISFAHEAGYNQLAELCDITAMCDINLEEAENRASIYRARAYKNYDDLLDDSNVDMVDIIVPHVMHFAIAQAALQMGKHVRLEKPLAATVTDGIRLLTLAEKCAEQSGAKFGVAENTRFVTAYQKAAEILDQGILGRIWSVRSMIAGSEVHRIKDPALWHGKAPYGGVILDSAVHHFYLYQWLFGGVSDLLGFASNIIPQGAMEDNCLILGHLVNKAEFQMTVSCTMEIPWMERFEFYGSRDGLIIDQLASPVCRLYLGSSDIDGIVVDAVPFDPLAWKFNSIIAEIKDFISAILEDRAPLVRTQDALYALQAAEATYQSIRQIPSFQSIDRFNTTEGG